MSVDRLPHVKSFRDLIVYQKSRVLTHEIFELTKLFPKDERYSLCDQIRRSSRSIGANLAEAWGKRSYERHFISKLTDADAEQLETQHWLEIAAECGYITTENMKQLLSKCEEIGRMLNSMMTQANKFCNPQHILREETAPYFIDPNNVEPASTNYTEN